MASRVINQASDAGIGQHDVLHALLRPQLAFLHVGPPLPRASACKNLSGLATLITRV